MYTTDKAINLAIIEAKNKFEAGKLFKSNDESPESMDFTDGDPETIYTLSSLYAQFVEDTNFDEAKELIEDSLIEIYPDFI